MTNRNKTYSSFTTDDIRQLGISMQSGSVMPMPVPPLAPSAWLRLTLEKNSRLPMVTEKAKSELIVSPILTELHESNLEVFTFFSGSTFDVQKDIGLKGRCDFLLSRKPHAIVPEAPVFAIVEAKNDSLEDGYAQCVAQLYAAEIFNQRNHSAFPFLFGAVTTGFLWKFIRYADKSATVHTEIFYMENLDELLGALQTVVDFYK